jgi:methylated-DNA-[protein]-cysteine S-methyltransferase
VVFRSLPVLTRYDLPETPVGPLRLFASDLGLCAVLWAMDTRPLARHLLAMPADLVPNELLTQAKTQLTAYFNQQQQRFDLPLHFPWGSAFQQTVWQALLTVPYGSVRTYGDMARQLGRPGAARAVGGAVGANPLGIMVPCHRVLGQSGQLTGFAGGLSVKSTLLDLEKTA